VRVLVEERRRLRKSDTFYSALGHAEVWFGRSEGEAPGVDGGIFFTGDANVGDFVDVVLEGHGPFDFYGRIAVRERVGLG
jgi:hypothetical protein